MAVGAVEDRNHDIVIHRIPVHDIGNAPSVGAVRYHASGFAAALTYKSIGRYIFHGAQYALLLIGFRTCVNDKPGEGKFSIHRSHLSLPYQERLSSGYMQRGGNISWEEEGYL